MPMALRGREKAVGTVTSILLVAFGGLFGPSSAMATSENSASSSGGACVPVAILSYRGSVNPNINASIVTHEGKRYRYANSDLVTNGWEGSILQRLFQPFAVTRYADGFRPDHVPVVAVGPAAADEPGYPAVHPASPVRDLVASIEGGVAAGAEAILRIVRSQPSTCETSTQFIAVGFSQGAIVTRVLAQIFPAVVGVINIGDPLQKPDATGNEGSGAAGMGIARSNFSAYREKIDRFYSLAIHKSALCHAGDPFCDFRGDASFLDLLDPTEHFSYMAGSFAHEADMKGRELADLAREKHVSSRNNTARASGGIDTLRIGASILATEGVPTTLSIVDPGNTLARGALRFRFDLDGDGVFETPSSSGVIRAIFPRSGTRTVSVQIAYSGGESVVASTQVDVAPGEALGAGLLAAIIGEF